MPFALTDLRALADLPFDEIIDARSPSEFAEDHIPGAINLPSLSDAERAEVGTIYVQEDPFLARKLGAAYVARNVADHLQGPLADRTGGWKPLVYCWRGGQRSGAFTVILKQIGWRADLVDGGYRAYRRLVSEALYETPWPVPVILIDGNTGTAKTRLLHQIAKAGGQILDLEAMAEHRGSLFGPMSEHQPSQKMFESRLAQALVGLDPARPVFVEAESSKIGNLMVPPSLWKVMIDAPRYFITAPIEARVGHLLEEYRDVIGAPATLDAILAKLIRYHGHEQIAAWRALAGAGDHAALAAELVALHYDPRYARITRHDAHVPLDLPDLSEATLARVAERLLSDS
ncbi:tRNA 2-selenouridine(34) synthase MnmH [Thioclava sp. A2]|uniref:tRNA 2-selenouridine(34) synthase MnmH n=1 Tax=Thioclava sp. FCG-A2 TaxID=3080562 RepID=UPI002955804F|nr:tRNA 2-selenouridine(34) synthase MnmH [Thioclava sp. A2]MDV7270057.1 tRNA 2-selenouridine(34) synthase MnmH [Thioclava sp. A2]